ncbi:hypothetical protein N0B16_02520 [Chryseobacterium sp. GMJ5]|uniref:Uncharacterized protein n=1 Tax=Chryseobacterium gilvum TaxID=2976534 RepID=A0ABT2VTH2_9FLAO|nr:hypothetical protein [Chryseobacterium gilvum]MCU7613299.1 hypothetical protein [Chryseobacterium gilvum]
MIFKSKYTIVFSKSRESILKNLENSIFTGFPDYAGKYFTGIVDKKGFRLKLMEQDHLVFKGKLINDENQKNTIKLSVRLDFYRLLLIILIICFLVVSNNGNYFILSAYIMIAVFLGYKNYKSSQKVKELFFHYLKKIDPDYKIISNTSY